MATIDAMNTPNLDAMEADDLLDFAGVAEALSLYARYKHDAIKLRLDGKVAKALAMEEKADRIYSSLPTWAKW